jgi:hypothetical protein
MFSNADRLPGKAEGRFDSALPRQRQQRGRHRPASFVGPGQINLQILYETAPGTAALLKNNNYCAVFN